jgi:hypothetical protein
MMARTANPAMPVAILALILASSCGRSTSRVQSRPIDCHFFPEGEPAACEQTSDGSIVLAAKSLASASFGPEGLSSIIVNNDLYFVNRHGKTAPALHFDNGPDYVVEGLARTVKDGKVGFVNPQLDQVVAPVWDFAFPFQSGVAMVCMGCVSTPVSPGDEHTVRKGGKWGYIDKRGKVVVPVEYDEERLPAPEVAARQALR